MNMSDQNSSASESSANKGVNNSANQVQTFIKVVHENRDRSTVFWRGILVAPVFIFMMAFSQSSFGESSSMGAAGVVALPAFLALVFRGVYPSYVLTFNHAITELSTRVFSYLFLLNDEYPSIERNPNIAVTFPDIEGGAKLSRGLPIVKWFLAIPLYIVGFLYTVLAFAVSIVAWVQTSFTGTYPAWAGDIVYGTINFWNRVIGYMLILVSDEYPSFNLK
jgi:hypothetical protein